MKEEGAGMVKFSENGRKDGRLEKTGTYTETRTLAFILGLIVL